MLAFYVFVKAVDDRDFYELFTHVSLMFREQTKSGGLQPVCQMAGWLMSCILREGVCMRWASLVGDALK